jgi:hypothetical protein
VGRERFAIQPAAPYIAGMANSPRTPRETIKVRRDIKPGDELMIPVTVTQSRAMKLGGSVEQEMLTIRIPGFGTPVTVSWKYLLGETDD